MRLEIRVVEIRGSCPVYRIGNRIVLDDGYKINLRESDTICMHSLASVLPYYNALARGVPPRDLGLSGGEGAGEEAYVQCLDPCRYTGGGTVTFGISRHYSR